VVNKLGSPVSDLLGCDASYSDGRFPRFEDTQAYRRGFMDDITFLLN
jgi:hypothetical protein